MFCANTKVLYLICTTELQTSPVMLWLPFCSENGMLNAYRTSFLEGGGGVIIISHINVRNSVKSLKNVNASYAYIYWLKYLYNWTVMLLKA